MEFGNSSEMHAQLNTTSIERSAFSFYGKNRLLINYKYICILIENLFNSHEPRLEITSLQGFRLGLTQTGLFSYRRNPES